jgi:hypothetical protein
MNIYEMLSFDFMEFATSTAGILIILGSLFLIIGIILLVKEGKKSPAEKGSSETADTSKEGEASSSTVVETVSEPAKVEAPQNNEESNAVTPVVVSATEDGTKDNVVEPISTETINFSEPTTTAPVIEGLKPETLDMPVVSSPEPETSAPVVEAPVVESLDSEESTEPQITVYGGASPEVLKPEVLEEKPREIYGGANPLENTSPIPVVAESTPVEAPKEEVVESLGDETVSESEPVTEAPAEVVTPVEPVTEAPIAPVENTEPAAQENKEELEKLEF